MINMSSRSAALGYNTGRHPQWMAAGKNTACQKPLKGLGPMATISSTNSSMMAGSLS